MSVSFFWLEMNVAQKKRRIEVVQVKDVEVVRSHRSRSNFPALLDRLINPSQKHSPLLLSVFYPSWMCQRLTAPAVREV